VITGHGGLSHGQIAARREAYGVDAADRGH
jgi:hypothetical protein